MKLSKSAAQLYNAQRPADAVAMPCWAPLKSMYLGFRGNVSVCCFNKMHVIGKFPEQSLEEIWNGPKMAEIRTALGEDDFSKGCHGCYELIDAGNYNALPAKNFDALPVAGSNFPTKIDFELSNECNLECVMCRGEFSSAIRRNREKLPAIPSAYDASLIEQLEAFIPHIHHSHFLGGEPFLIPFYLNIWERMVDLNPGIRISVQTNGTILTDRIKKILDSIRFEIGVSIDSIDAANYEVIRKNADFDKVMDNIAYFREYCQERNTHFHLSYCPMVQNWRELPEVIAFANSLDCEVFFNTVYKPANCSLAALGAEELQAIVVALQDAPLPVETAIQRTNRRSFEQVVKQLEYWGNEALQKEQRTLGTAEVDTIQGYLAGLQNYLNEQEELTAAERHQMQTEISSKLSYILEVADQHGMYAKAEEHLMQMDYKTVCQSVPKVEKEHLLYLFKSFIMPLPD